MNTAGMAVPVHIIDEHLIFGQIFLGPVHPQAQCIKLTPPVSDFLGTRYAVLPIVHVLLSLQSLRVFKVNIKQKWIVKFLTNKKPNQLYS
jgi:hypothetical protein